MFRDFCGIIYNVIIRIEQSERNVCNCIDYNLPVSVDWNEHPCFDISAIIAFVVFAHRVVRFLFSPVAEFYAYNRFFVVIFNKFDCLLNLSQINQCYLPLLIAYNCVLSPIQVIVNASNWIIHEFLSIFLVSAQKNACFFAECVKVTLIRPDQNVAVLNRNASLFLLWTKKLVDAAGYCFRVRKHFLKGQLGLF